MAEAESGYQPPLVDVPTSTESSEQKKQSPVFLPREIVPSSSPDSDSEEHIKSIPETTRILDGFLGGLHDQGLRLETTIPVTVEESQTGVGKYFVDRYVAVVSEKTEGERQSSIVLPGEITPNGLSEDEEYVKPEGETQAGLAAYLSELHEQGLQISAVMPVTVEGEDGEFTDRYMAIVNKSTEENVA